MNKILKRIAKLFFAGVLFVGFGAESTAASTLKVDLINKEQLQDPIDREMYLALIHSSLIHQLPDEILLKDFEGYDSEAFYNLVYSYVSKQSQDEILHIYQIFDLYRKFSKYRSVYLRLEAEKSLKEDKNPSPEQVARVNIVKDSTAATYLALHNAFMKNSESKYVTELGSKLIPYSDETIAQVGQKIEGYTLANGDALLLSTFLYGDLDAIINQWKFGYSGKNVEKVLAGVEHVGLNSKDARLRISYIAANIGYDLESILSKTASNVESIYSASQKRMLDYDNYKQELKNKLK